MFNLYLVLLVLAVYYKKCILIKDSNKQEARTELDNLADLLTLEVDFRGDDHFGTLQVNEIETELSTQCHLKWCVFLHCLSVFVVFRCCWIGLDETVHVAKLRVVEMRDVIHLVITANLLARLPG